MSKPIFFDCITNEGNKSINIENIALIENINNKTIITLNVKKIPKKIFRLRLIYLGNMLLVL